MANNFDNYFGLPDAAKESPDDVVAQHVSREYESRLKIGDSKTGKQIVIGIKGSGKTALRRFIEKKESALIWNIDCDNSYMSVDASTVAGRSGNIKNSLALELLRTFAEVVAQDKDKKFGLSGKATGLLRSGTQAAIDILKRVPDAVEIDAKLAKVNVGKLLSSNAGRFVSDAWDSMHEKVLKALGSHRAYIMIDDAEDVFPGLERNPVFIEGLARAIADINEKSGASLHALLFLKHGVWRTWRDNEKEYDKVDHVIQMISWTRKSLSELIAKRIASRHKKSDKSAIDIEKSWSLEFEWEGPFVEFTESILQYCVSGPRDLISLCNLAKEHAREKKIARSHIIAVLKGFSESKILGIGADFGDVYPDIQKFVERVFEGCPVEMSGQQVADWIEQKAFLTDAVHEVFSSLKWYKTMSKESLTLVMYQIGLLGIRRGDGTITYAIESPQESKGDVLDSQLIVHPAFRPHLSVAAVGNQAGKKSDARRK